MQIYYKINKLTKVLDMAQKLKTNILGAAITKIGIYSIATVNSLHHGGPYIIISYKGDRVGWVSFKTRRSNNYTPKHEHFDKAKILVDDWFENDNNYNLAAIAWNAMGTGVNVSLLGEKNESTKKN
jgi:hypothetical protein